MNVQVQPHVTTTQRHLPFECVALVLQGGGALGAYQAGVYEALSEAGIHPDWIAGISIGAINAAIIGGNPPNSRVDRLREFWTQVTADGPWPFLGDAKLGLARGDAARNFLSQMSATMALANGASGFFAARPVTPWLQPGGTIEATSFYDTKALKRTLEHLVDFDLLNAGIARFSVGSVNVRTGNFAYFDSTTHTIRPEHVMASGALPPGFPATEIEGEQYWDGGLVSNTPLQWVLDTSSRKDTLAFQVDLWSARGDFPRNLLESEARQKDIRFSSRTRMATDQFKKQQLLRRAAAKLLAQMPKDLLQTPEAEVLAAEADEKVYNVIQLIYRSKNYEGTSKDYQFSRGMMEEHWTSGYNDAVRTLRHPEVLQRPNGRDGFFTFDLGRDGRE